MIRRKRVWGVGMRVARWLRMLRMILNTTHGQTPVVMKHTTEVPREREGRMRVIIEVLRELVHSTEAPLQAASVVLFTHKLSKG